MKSKQVKRTIRDKKSIYGIVALKLEIVASIRL